MEFELAETGIITIEVNEIGGNRGFYEIGIYDPISSILPCLGWWVCPIAFGFIFASIVIC
ncbi:MAG: hypothetical protein GF411_14590 [Candidatus Lokiarchaeota archaeon]|nr:hypothetical protein [Candidatus Lokiarchaeota archaeon]